MEYLTTVELSERWNITSRRIGVLCAEGRIEGAIKKGKTWLIPSDILKFRNRKIIFYETICQIIRGGSSRCG